MGYLQKYTREALIAAGITAFFCFSRLYNILELPIFTDEAIYLRWAQYLLTDPKFWDYSLTDGKQPLFIWFMTVSMFLINDPLLAGRLVSVLSGFFTMIGLFFLSRELFKNRWIGLIAAALYAVYSFAIVYDKMALYDSMVGTFAVWGLYLVVLLVRYVRVDLAVFLGITAGLGAINKSNGFFTLILLPFSLLMFDVKHKDRNKRFRHWVGFCVLAGVISFGIYSLLRLSPYFHIIDQKNATFVYPLAEWLQHPFTYFWDNLWVGQRDWLLKYFGYPYLILSAGAFVVKQKNQKEKLVLLVWFLVPFITLALFGRTIYPRYIFFMTLSLLPLVAYTFYHVYYRVKNVYLFIVFVSLALFLPLRISYFVLSDFAHAPIPISDLSQYNNDWPAGTGVKETTAFLRKEAEKGKIALYTEGTFGLLPYAYELYFHDHPNVTITGIWPIKDQAPADMLEAAKKMPTYVVFYQPCPPCSGVGKGPPLWPLEEVMVITKEAPGTYLTLYRVKTE